MNFEVEISYKANLDIRHIYDYYVMNNIDLNFVQHLINGIISLIKSLEYLPKIKDLVKKMDFPTRRSSDLLLYKIDDKVYILRVIHHSQNITTNFFLAENEIPYVVE